MVVPFKSVMAASASDSWLIVTKAYPLVVIWISSTVPTFWKGSSSTDLGQLRDTPYTNSLAMMMTER